MSASITTVTSKGQVTIPKPIREALGITERDQLLFVIDGDRAVMIPIRHRSISELFAVLPANRPFPGVQAIRDEVRKAISSETNPGSA